MQFVNVKDKNQLYSEEKILMFAKLCLLKFASEETIDGFCEIKNVDLIKINQIINYYKEKIL